MSKTLDLVLKIRADTKGAVGDVDNLAKKLGGAEITGTSFGTKLSGVFGQLKGAFSSLPPEAQAAGAAAAVAGAAFTKFALDGVEKFAALTTEVRNVQRATGATATQSSELAIAFKTTGVGIDAGSAAMGRFAAKIGSGKIDLQQYGVEIARNKDGSVNLVGTLGNLADVYSHTGDQTVKAALGQAAFGRGFQQLSPLLGKTKGELQALYDSAGRAGLIFHQDDLEKGREFNVAVQQLHQSFEGLQVAVGGALIGPLTTLTDTLSGTLNTLHDIANVIPGVDFGTIAENAVSTIPVIGPAFKVASDAIGFLSSNSDDGAGASARLAAAQKAAADTARDQAAAIKAASDALMAKNDATLASFDSEIAAAKSNEALATALASGTTGLDLQSQALQTAEANAKNLADQYEATSGKTADATQKNDFLKLSLIKIGDQYPALRGLVQGYIDRLNAVPKTIDQSIALHTNDAESSFANFRNRIATDPVYVHLVAVGAAGVSAGGAGIRRALGGTLPGYAMGGLPAGASWVGEQGPEIFMPKQGGRILSRPDSMAAIRSGGSGTTTVHIHVDAGSAHPAQVGEAVVTSLAAYVRSNGSGALKTLVGV